MAPRKGITLLTNHRAFSPRHGCQDGRRLMMNQERIIITRVQNEVDQRAGEASQQEKRMLYGCLCVLVLPWLYYNPHYWFGTWIWVWG